MKNKIQYTTVKVITSVNNVTSFGSGTILKIEETYYVITAEHCVFGDKDNRNNYTSVSVENISIEYRHDFNDESKQLRVLSIEEEDESRDYVLIKIEKPDIDFDFESIHFGSFEDEKDKECCFRGYGNKHPNGARTYECICKERSYDDLLIKLKNDTFHQASDAGHEVAEGLSGSGIFYSDGEKCYYVGLVKELRDAIGTFDDFYSLSSTGISLLKTKVEIIKDKPSFGWDTQEITLLIASIQNKELQNQWQRELETYFGLLKKFRPKTALNLLDTFLEKIDKQQTDPKLLAFSYFQKGYCYELLNDSEQANKCFLEAYELDSENNSYIEKAVLIFAKQGDKNKEVLISGILRKQPESSIAWAAKYINLDTNELSVLVTQTPINVRKNVVFQQIIFNSYLQEGISKIEPFEKDLLPTIKELKEEIDNLTITIDTWEQAQFMVNWLFSLYIRTYNFFDFSNGIPVSNRQVFELLHTLLKKIENALKDSEIPHLLYSSLLHFSSYISSGNKEELLKALKNIEEMPVAENYLYFFVCANFLQQEKEYELSVEILSKLENLDMEDFEKCSVLNLMSIVYGYQCKMDEGCDCLKKSITGLSSITDRTYWLCLNSLFTLSLFGEIDESLIKNIEEKNYSNSEIQKFVITYANCLWEKSTEKYEGEIMELLEDSSFVDLAKIYIGNLFYFTGKYHKAISIYDIYKDIIKARPRELMYYIRSLWLSTERTDPAFTISLCEYWRSKYPIEETVLEVEYCLKSLYLNWKSTLQVTEIGFKTFRNENWLLRLMYCLDRLGDGVQLKRYIDTYLAQEIISNKNIGIVIRLIARYDYDMAIDLALKYSEDPQIKMLFFQFYLDYGSKSITKDKFKDYEIVEEGLVVTCQSDKKKYDIVIDTHSDKLEKVTISKLMIGKKIGDEIILKPKVGKFERKLIIEKISDKYLHQIKECYNDAESPISELPMSKFPIDPEKPIESLIENLGIDESAEIEKQKDKNTLVESYYNQLLSIHALSYPLFMHSPIWCLDILSKTNGIKTIPIQNYFWNGKTQNQSFILDLSSVYILYSISQKYKIGFPKMYVSRYLVETIKDQIRRLKDQPRLFGSMLSSLPTILNFNSSDYEYNQIERLLSIIRWIEDTCVVTINDVAVDQIRLIEQNIVKWEKQELERYFTHIIIPTVCLTEMNEEFRLITDDPVLYNDQFSNKHLSSITISTEYFIKQLLGNESDASWQFIEKRYLGYTFTTKQLINLYNTKERNIDRLNLYIFAIKNIGIWNIRTCFDLCRHILQSTEKDDDIKEIIISLYNNSDEDVCDKVIDFFKISSLKLNEEHQNRMHEIIGSVLSNKLKK